MRYYTKEWNSLMRSDDGLLPDRSNFRGWFEEKSDRLRLTDEEYWKHFSELKKRLPPDFEFAKVHMHDCRIVKEQIIGVDLVMWIDPKGGFADVKKLTFANVEIIENEGSLTGTWWLINELYLTENGKYEIHVLCSKFTNDVEQFVGKVIQADDVIVERSQ